MDGGGEEEEEEEKKKKRRKMGNKDFLLQPLLAAYSAVVLRRW